MPTDRESEIVALDEAYHALVPYENRHPAIENAIDAIHYAIRTLCPDEAEYDRLTRDTHA